MSEEVQRILETRLKAVVPTGIPIAWDNSDYVPVIGKLHIQCVLDQVLSEILSNSCQRETYLFSLKVFAPAGEGVKNSIELCSLLTDVFFNYIESNLWCKTAKIHRVGNQEQWYRQDVLIDVQNDNHFTNHFI